MSKFVIPVCWTRTIHPAVSLFIFLSAWSFCSCSGQSQKNNGKQEPLEANITVRYDAAEQSLKAVVRVIKDQNGIQILQPVKLEGRQMIYLNSPAIGPNYSVTREFEYDSIITIQIRESVFNIPIPILENASASEGFNKSKGGRIWWDGQALANGEMLNLLFEDQNKAFKNLNRLGPSSSNSTVIFPEQIDTLSVGPLSLNLIRRFSYSDFSEGINAKIAVEYYAKPAKFELDR